MSDAPQPRDGETWRTKSGRERRIIAMAEDGYWIDYVRPAPADNEPIVVLMQHWMDWVEREQAVRVGK